jgi:hypothetical protein
MGLRAKRKLLKSIFPYWKILFGTDSEIFSKELIEIEEFEIEILSFLMIIIIKLKGQLYEQY